MIIIEMCDVIIVHNLLQGIIYNIYYMYVN